jgi:hypothetical protein
MHRIQQKLDLYCRCHFFSCSDSWSATFHASKWFAAALYVQQVFPSRGSFTLPSHNAGAIDVDELQHALSVLGVNKTAAEVQELMESVDNDGSGKPTSNIGTPLLRGGYPHCRQ